MDKLITLKNDSACPVSFNAVLKDNQKIRLDVNSKQSVGLFMDAVYAPKQVDVIAHLPSGQPQRLEGRVISDSQSVLTICDGVRWQTSQPTSQLGTSKALTFTMQVQQQSNWCWAAVSSSVNDFYQPSTPPAISQIDLAVEAFKPECIRSSPSSPKCNQPNTLDWGLKFVKRWKAFLPRTMPMLEIQACIDAGQPVGVAIKRATSNIGHAVAISGYDTVTATITVNDPAAGSTRVLSLATFPGITYRDYTWIESYPTKT